MAYIDYGLLYAPTLNRRRIDWTISKLYTQAGAPAGTMIADSAKLTDKEHIFAVFEVDWQTTKIKFATRIAHPRKIDRDIFAYRLYAKIGSLESFRG